MADRKKKRPAFQWYPGDFRRDLAVQACSFEARALWREMLDLMHDGAPYGHLTAGGIPIETAQLARIVGVSAPSAKRWLKELEDRKVFSRTEAGVIYSRRMVRDERLREIRADCGHLGGNPALVSPPKDGEKVKQKPKQPDNQTAKQKPTPAVAVAFAVTTAPEEGRVGTSGTKAPEPASAALSFADLPPAAREFITTLYPRATSKPERRTEVAQQLLDTLGEGARLSGSAQRVRAQSPERLEAKCREVLASPLRNPDRAIVVLLKKLADTSDGSAPGHRAEAAAAGERQDDERTGAQRTALAEAWLDTLRPDMQAELQRLLDANPSVPKDPADPLFKIMRRAELWRLWAEAGEPEVPHV